MALPTSLDEKLEPAVRLRVVLPAVIVTVTFFVETVPTVRGAAPASQIWNDSGVPTSASPTSMTYS